MPRSRRAANWFCAIGSISWWPVWMTWTPKTSCTRKWSRPWITPSSSVAREPTSRKRTVSGGEQVSPIGLSFLCAEVGESLCFRTGIMFLHLVLFSSLLFCFSLWHTSWMFSCGFNELPRHRPTKDTLILTNWNPPAEYHPLNFCYTFHCRRWEQKTQHHGWCEFGWKDDGSHYVSAVAAWLACGSSTVLLL